MNRVLPCLAVLVVACTGEIDNTNTTGVDASANAADSSTNPAADARNNPTGPDARQNFGEPAALMGITAAHNEVRAGVGVGPMEWNDSLAVTAQAWADSCVDNEAPAGLIDHNANRSNGHPWYVGENIYGSGGGATGIAALNAWASEGQDYDYATNSCAAGRICGHYTQVVWATSTQLGCGISSCAGLQYGNSIVCNYGPGGNIGGQSPY